jgi:orotidine-5'-phosphate decarboxylase
VPRSLPSAALSCVPFLDRRCLAVQALIDSARRKESPLVVGLDPVPSRFPKELQHLPAAVAVQDFCRSILEAVEPHAAAVKLQAAFFERLGTPGMEVYGTLISDATSLGLPAIADVKRGDIGPVAAAYAEAHLAVYGASCVTVNPFMGEDAVRPFLEEARRLGRGGGVFVLVATSNPSAECFQGATAPPLFEVAARLVAELGGGAGDYPDAGAVVGATRPEVGRRVRELLPEALFLVPGYGAQGGGAAGIRPLLDGSGAGVLVNSSRAVIYAHEASQKDYRKAAREAAKDARDELRSAGVRPA